MRNHLLNVVLTKPLFWSSPDTGTAVRMFKAEPELISEDDLRPLLRCPQSMMSAPTLSSSFVEGRQLWPLRWAARAELDSVQGVPYSLCGDVGVDGRPRLPPDAICSGFPRRLGLSTDT